MKVKNSRFIGSLGHTPTVESAREYINCIKSRFPDARHHCYAFCIGHGASVTQGMSDDGEPSGTAGWPPFPTFLSPPLPSALSRLARRPFPARRHQHVRRP